MKVKILKKTVGEVAEHWKNQYKGNCLSWSKCLNEDSEEVYNKLLKAKTLKECDEIIGNQAWTTFQCSECDELFYIGKVIIVGERVKWERDTFEIKLCKKCYDKLENIITQQTTITFSLTMIPEENKKFWRESCKFWKDCKKGGEVNASKNIKNNKS
jgi:hypothetical protein